MSNTLPSLTASVVELPLPPQRWILVGHDQAWRDAAVSRFQESTHSMVSWRWDAGLIVVKSPEEFELGLRQAVELRAPEVAIFVQDGTPDPGPAFRRVFPQEHPHTLPRLYEPCTLDAIERVLWKPEWHVIWRWLTNGRQRMPAVGLDRQDLAQRALQAHEAWVMVYRQDWTDDELDEMFGTGDAAEGDDAAAPFDGPAEASNVLDFPTVGTGGDAEPALDQWEPWRLAAVGGTGDVSASGNAGRIPVDGVGMVDWELIFPPEMPDDDQPARIEVRLTLERRKWQEAGLRAPTVTLHPRHMLPMRERMPGWDDWHDQGSGTAGSSIELHVDAAVADALNGSRAVNLLVIRPPSAA